MKITNLPQSGDIVKIFNFVDFEKGKFEIAKVRPVKTGSKALGMWGLAQNNHRWKYTQFEIGLTDIDGKILLNGDQEPLYKLNKIRTTKWGYSLWKCVFNPVKR